MINAISLSDRSGLTEQAIVDFYRDQSMSDGLSFVHHYLKVEAIRKAALDYLIEKKIIERIPDPYGPDIYERGARSWALLQDMPANSPYKKIEAYGWIWLSEALQKIDKAYRETPPEISQAGLLAAPNWEPLPIDRSGEAYLHAVAKSEEALQAIEGDNGYAATEPEERNAVVSSIRGTLEAIKNGFPSKLLIVHGLLAPLKQVVTRFGSSVVGEFAKRAAEAIARWIFGN
jgi:hypothetical protein